MCEIREKKGFVLTPSVLAGAWVDGGSITEIGNTKRGEVGRGWNHELFGIAGSAEFCAIQAVILQGVRNMDLLLR